MRLRHILGSIVVISMFLLSSCNLADDENASADIDFISSFDFETGHQDWIAGVSDYSAMTTADNAEYSFSFFNSRSPENLPWQGYGLTITAENPHGDLFYYFKKQISGLNPGKKYKVDFEFIVYTQLEAGVQVASTEDIFLKVGAVQTEPMARIDPFGIPKDYYVLNHDKGTSDAGSGTNIKNLGSIKNYTKSTAEAISGNTYKSSLQVLTDNLGTMWLIIGVDSSIKNQLTFGLLTMTVYYTEIK